MVIWKAMWMGRSCCGYTIDGWFVLSYDKAQSFRWFRWDSASGDWFVRAIKRRFVWSRDFQISFQSLVGCLMSIGVAVTVNEDGRDGRMFFPFLEFSLVFWVFVETIWGLEGRDGSFVEGFFCVFFMCDVRWKMEKGEGWRGFRLFFWDFFWVFLVWVLYGSYRDGRFFWGKNGYGVCKRNENMGERRREKK